MTVQLDAVQIGAGAVLRRTPGAGAAPEAAPVFVDESGRRNRLYRRIGLAVGLACAGYAVVMVATLLSGNSDAPWMPVPGQEGKPAEQVETTPGPSATDPVPSSGTSLDPGLGTPTPGASDLPGPGASAPAAGGGPAARCGSRRAAPGDQSGGPRQLPAGHRRRRRRRRDRRRDAPDRRRHRHPAHDADHPGRHGSPATSDPTGGGQADGTDSLSAPSADRPVAAEPAAGDDSAPAAPSPENVL